MNIKKIRKYIIALMLIVYMVSVASASPNVKFYANKAHFHDDSGPVELTLYNKDKKASVFVSCDETIEIKQKIKEKYKSGKKWKTRTVYEDVDEIPWELDGCNNYNGGTITFTAGGDITEGTAYMLEPKESLSEEWDQAGQESGKYVAETHYTYGKKKIKKSTAFELKDD